MAGNDLQIIKRVYAAFEAKDFGVIEAVFAPDVEITQSDLVPWGGRFRGRPGAVEFFTGLLGHIDPRLTVEQIVDAGDHVLEIGRTAGRTVASGTPFDLPEIHIWRLRDEKVVSMQVYIDVPAMLAALSE